MVFQTPFLSVLHKHTFYRRRGNIISDYGLGEILEILFFFFYKKKLGNFIFWGEGK
jgi:hypothetical protein